MRWSGRFTCLFIGLTLAPGRSLDRRLTAVLDWLSAQNAPPIRRVEIMSTKDEDSGVERAGGPDRRASLSGMRAVAAFTMRLG
jgi:hypothetical protein